jgi:Haem-NO-binding
MQGLIFVTWEKYLAERFGGTFLNIYRVHIGETSVNAPLASRVYDDATLIAGVTIANKLSGMPIATLLREYGRYFILNGLTDHLCAYLLTRVHSGRELLLMMRDAHTQMRRTPDNVTPPLFMYEPISLNPQEFALIYESPRKLCSILYGAIEGAAERYGEQVNIIERTCMHQGGAVCRFDLRFSTNRSLLMQPETPEMINQRRIKQQMAELVLSALPITNGITLLELQALLQQRASGPFPFRVSTLLEALRHLQFAGLAASTANQPGDTLSLRRYWRAPTQTNI